MKEHDEIQEMVFQILDAIEPIIKAKVKILFEDASEEGKRFFSRPQERSKSKSSHLIKTAMEMANTSDPYDLKVRNFFYRLHGGKEEARRKSFNRAIEGLVK